MFGVRWHFLVQFALMEGRTTADDNQDDEALRCLSLGRQNDVAVNGLP